MTQTMRAAVYRGVDDVRVETVSMPEIGPGDVLVRIAACGVCGTDLKKIRYGLVPPPRIFGHETTGEIAAIGEQVRGWHIGERVAVNHHVPCRSDRCHYCRRKEFAQCPTYRRTGASAGFEPAGGGFAEYVRVMDWCVDAGLVRVPDEVTLEEASFIEPLNTCLKGIEKAGLQRGDTAVVIGQGPIGLLFTQLVGVYGAHTVATDRNLDRLEVSRRFGAEALDADHDDINAAVRRHTEGRGADLAIVAVPSTEAARSAFELVRPAGKVLLFAHTRLNDLMDVDAGAICMQEKTLLGSYSSDIALQDRAAGLIFSRAVDVRPLITHRFPLERIGEAIDYAANPRDGSLKIVVGP